MCGGVGSSRGTGGMVTKLSAAKIATLAGINMVLANGDNPILFMTFGRQGSGFTFPGPKIRLLILI